MARMTEAQASTAWPKWVDACACAFCDTLDLELCGDVHLRVPTPGAEFFLVCRGCRASGPIGATPQEAAARWNQRRGRGPLQYVEVECPCGGA